MSAKMAANGIRTHASIAETATWDKFRISTSLQKPQYSIGW